MSKIRVFVAILFGKLWLICSVNCGYSIRQVVGMRRTAAYGNMPTPCKNVKTIATFAGYHSIISTPL